MKIESGGEVVFGNNKNQSKSFSIASSSKAFKILSSSLYKNKIRAIVRELSCNCLDAHKLNGNTIPFKIIAPTWLDQTFVVRDYGPGLSDDDIMNLYTTYFASTKDQSNDFIGALGLGSKSPFSYTDTFTVKSHFNGFVTQYSAMMVNGEPSIVKVSEKSSDALTGLEISIPVKKDDIDKWVQEIKYVLHCFPTDTYDIGSNSFTIDSLSNEFYETGCSIETLNFDLRTLYSHSSVYAVYGNIAYPLNQVPKYNETLSWMLATNENKVIFVHFELGELDITPSREELSLDDITVENINKKLLELNTQSLEDEIKELERLKDSVDNGYVSYNLLRNCYGYGTFKTIMALDVCKSMRSGYDKITDGCNDIKEILRTRLYSRGKNTPTLKAYDSSGQIGYHNKGRNFNDYVSSIIISKGDDIEFKLNRSTRRIKPSIRGNIAFIVDDNVASHTLPKILKNISNPKDVFGDVEYKAYIIIDSVNDEVYKKAISIDSTLEFELLYMEDIYKKAVLNKKDTSDEKRPVSPNGFKYSLVNGNLTTEPLYLTAKEVRGYNGYILYLYGDNIIDIDSSVDLTKVSPNNAIKNKMFYINSINKELIEMIGGELIVIRPTHWKYVSNTKNPLTVWKDIFKKVLDNPDFVEVISDFINISAYEKSTNKYYGEFCDLINEKFRGLHKTVDVENRDFIIDNSSLVRNILEDDSVSNNISLKYYEILNTSIFNIRENNVKAKNDFKNDYPLIDFLLNKINIYSRKDEDAIKEMIDYVKEKL